MTDTGEPKTAPMSVEALYQAITDGSYPPEQFCHEEHVRLAWYYLTRWPLPEAADRFDRDFDRFIEQAGARDKYHCTITFALLQLIFSHLDTEETRSDWNAFKADATPLFSDAIGLLMRHFSRDRLFSEEARLTWVDPDLAPLPGPAIRPITQRG